MPTSTLFVGIDTSLKTNQACAINFNQDTFFNKSFDNSPSGTEQLTLRILNVFNKHKELKKLVICMEATNVYHIHVSSILANEFRFQPYDCKVYVQNAKLIEKYKETFMDRSKTDPEDAFLCADYARVGKCNKSHPVIGYQKIALQRLTRQRRHVAEQLGKEKQYVSSNLYLKFSAMKVNSELNPFSNIYSKTSSFMLTDFLTNEEIINADISNLISKLCELSKNRFDDSELVAKNLKKMARDSYRLDKVSADSISSALASSFRLIQVYEKELKELDKEILRLIEGLNNNYLTILTSIKGIGLVYAAGIIAEIDDINFFKNDSHLASYCGLRWKRKDSGSKKSEHKKQTNACNTYLRYYIVEAAGSIIRYNDEYATYYYKKRSEVKINAHKRALVLTARKFVRLLFGLLRNNKLYDNQHNLTVNS